MSEGLQTPLPVSSDGPSEPRLRNWVDWMGLDMFSNPKSLSSTSSQDGLSLGSYGYTKAEVKGRQEKCCTLLTLEKNLTGLRPPLEGCYFFTQRTHKGQTASGMHRAVTARAGSVIGVSENILTRFLGLLAPTTEPGCKKTLGQGILEAGNVTMLPWFFTL